MQETEFLPGLGRSPGSSATPSFPSQPEGKIGLPRANPRGRLTGKGLILPSGGNHVVFLVGCHALLQGIFPTQGLNPGLTLPADSLPAEPPGKRKDYWSPECGGLSSYANCHSLVPVSHYSHLRHRLFFLHAPRPAQPCQDPRETRCWPLCCKSTLRHRRQTSLGPMEGESVGCGESASRPSLHP